MRKHIPALTLFLLLIISIIACCFCINTISKRNDTIIRLSAQLEQAKINYDNLEKEYDDFKSKANEEEPVLPAKVDSGKMLYNTDQYIRTALLYDSLSGIDVLVNDNKFTVRTNDDAETYFYYNGDPVIYESNELDKEVVQVMVCGYGSSCKVLFLMQDGTVKYIEGSSIIKRDFTLHDIDNLKDVVRLQKAVFSRNNGGINIMAVAVMSDNSSKVIE